jgi:biotin carboxyl carrier protein
VAGVRPLRITDRATGTILGDVVVGPAGTADAATNAEPLVDGWRFELVVEDAERAALRDRATSARAASSVDGPLDIHAIIPGRVASVAVVAGDTVTAGSRLLAVEAMKMENDVRAPRDGVVERVAVAAGETVDLGDLLVTLR